MDFIVGKNALNNESTRTPFFVLLYITVLMEADVADTELQSPR